MRLSYLCEFALGDTIFFRLSLGLNATLLVMLEPVHVGQLRFERVKSEK